VGRVPIFNPIDWRGSDNRQLAGEDVERAEGLLAL